MNISKYLVTIFSGDGIVDIPTEGLEKTINNRIYCHSIKGREH